MPKGLWVWPADPRGQRRVLRMVAATPRLLAALAAIGKSKDGLSNAEVADAIGETAEWPTVWVIRQLTSLGFIGLKVDFFGNPAKYNLTEAGRVALSMITGQPLTKPPAPSQPAAPKAA